MVWKNKTFKMKKMFKFGGRRRYNGEEGSKVGEDRPDDAAKDEGLDLLNY